MSPDPNLWSLLAAVPLASLQDLADLVASKAIGWSVDPNWSEAETRRHLHDELLISGGNGMRNIVRGSGPPWADIVRDVADKCDVVYLRSDATADVEAKVATTILERAVNQMTPEQLAELRANLEREGLPKDVPLGPGMMAAILGAGNAAGFAAYIALVKMANAIARTLLGRGLAFATNAALTRVLGVVLGPIGWAMATAWTAIDLAGPAYRITIPATVYVAMWRAQQRVGLLE